jgi:hypothetical protein
LRLSELSLPDKKAARYSIELNDRLRRVERQVNGLTEGFVFSIHNSVAAVPTSGLHSKGDFIRSKDQVESSVPGGGEHVGFGVTWVPSSVDATFFTASRACTVRAIRARVDTAGTDAGAVTASIRKVPSGTVITSGTLLHTGSIDLKGTVDVVQTLTLSATPSDLDLAVGDSIAVDFSGVLTAARGSLTVMVDFRGRYVVIGWYCVANGTPGTWVECRCPTGN